MSNFLNFAGNQGLTFKDHGTGGGTSFTLDANASTNSVLLTVGGILQSPGVDYSVSGTTITTTSSVTSGVEVLSYVVHKPGTAPTIQDNSISNAKMLDDAVGLAELSATGTPSSSNFLRGDNAWATPSGGKVAQVVQAETNSIINTTNSISNDTSIPQISEGAEALTCAITPTNASSTLFIFVDMVLGSGGGGVGSIIALFKDSTADALQSKVVQTGQVNVVHADAKFIHKIAAGSTSAQTFKLRFAASGGGTVGINSYDGSTASMGSTMKTSLIIMEVSP